MHKKTDLKIQMRATIVDYLEKITTLTIKSNTRTLEMDTSAHFRKRSVQWCDALSS